MDYSAVGQTTHLAARMEQLASPGTSLLTLDTWRLVEGFVEVRSLGPVPVKGLARPVHAFELLASARPRTRFEAATARGLKRFIGRERELETLRRCLAEAASGHGQLVAQVGDAGVGKSRLVWEFTHAPWIEGWRVLEAPSISFGQATPYRPLIEMLKGYFALHDVDDDREIGERVVAKLQALDHRLDDLAPAILALLGVPAVDPEWDRRSSRERRRLIIEAVTTLLVRESELHPLILVFEDLHWVDTETEAVLDVLVGALPTSRIVMVVNYRPEYRHAWSTRPYCTELSIGPLPAEKADEFLDTLLGVDADLEALKHLLATRTEGNPFFLEESVRALVESSTLVRGPDRWRLARPIETVEIPATIQAVLAARLDRLTGANKWLLQCASVIGKDVPFALLHALDGPVAPLRESLVQLQAAEFVYAAGDNDEYTFKHGLTQEVVYETLLLTQRTQLHAAVVISMERLYADRLHEHIERLAHHAVQGQLWDKAVAYLREAGRRAFARSAYRVASACFEQAIDGLEHLPRGRAVLEDAIDLRLDARYALTALGDFPRALARLREAEAQAIDLGDQHRLGRVTSFLTNYFQVTGDLASAVESGHRALSVGESIADASIQVVASAYLSSAYQIRGDYRRSSDHARRTIQLLGPDAAPDRLGMALLPSVYARNALSGSLAELGRFDEAVEVGDEALMIAERERHLYSVAFACLALGLANLRQGRLERATEMLERGLQTCRASDAAALASRIAGFLALAHAAAGRCTEALLVVGQGDGQASAVGLPDSTLGYGVRLTARSEVQLGTGRLADAEKLAVEALQFFRGIGASGYEGWTLRLLADVSARRDPGSSAAETGYRDAVRIAETAEMRPLIAHCHLGLARLYRDRQRSDDAHAHVGQALELARSMVMPLLTEQTQRLADELASARGT